MTETNYTNDANDSGAADAAAEEINSRARDKVEAAVEGAKEVSDDVPQSAEELLGDDYLQGAPRTKKRLKGS